VNLIRIPDELSFVDTCGMACRYAAAFHAVVDQASVRGGEWVAVHGVGGMGLSAVQIAAAVGAKVIAVDPSVSARSAAMNVGAAHAIDPTHDEPVEAIRTLTRGGAHVSIDALGVAETCRGSVLSLRKLGRHLQTGHTTRNEAGDVALPIDHILLNELRLLGGFGLPASRYGAMIAMVQAGILEPRKVVLQRVALEETTPVFAAMSRYETTGIVVIDRFRKIFQARTGDDDAKAGVGDDEGEGGTRDVNDSAEGRDVRAGSADPVPAPRYRSRVAWPCEAGEIAAGPAAATGLGASTGLWARSPSPVERQR
jgi:D-arabinose 1-dehydrogenase-like Zn-dependent alcohol dehydrogenase